MTRKGYLVFLGSVLIFLMIVGTCLDVPAWVGNPAAVEIHNRKGPRINNGVLMVLYIVTTDPVQAQDVKSIRAWNTDPGIDPTIYTDWRQFNSVRKTVTLYQFVIETEYAGQHGAYTIEVTYQDDSTETLTTPSINQWADPFLPPADLEIDYSTGVTTPTFKFMPVDDPDVDYYWLRLRVDDGTNQVRMIYRAEITTWTLGQPIEVTFPHGSDGRGTEEPLEPGREYHVRVEARDSDGASSPPTEQAEFRSDDRFYFRLPAAHLKTFSGVIRDFETSDPVEGALVYWVGSQEVSSTSSADGSYTLPRIPGGDDILLRKTKVGYRPTYSMPELLAPWEDVYFKDYWIVSEATYDIIYSELGMSHVDGTGDILGEIVPPVDGATITATDLEGNPVGQVGYLGDFGWTLGGGTDSAWNSEFAVVNVPPGMVIVWAQLGGENFSIQRCVVFPDAVTRGQLISGNPTVTASGMVYGYPAETPLGGATISLPGTDYSTSSDSNGNFSIPGMPQWSQFYYKTAKAGYTTVYEYGNTLGWDTFDGELGTITDSFYDQMYAAMEVTHILGTGDLISDVWHEEQGKPIGGAVVRIMDEEGNVLPYQVYYLKGNLLPDPSLTSTVKGVGVWISPNVPPGVYYVQASKEGHAFTIGLNVSVADSLSGNSSNGYSIPHTLLSPNGGEVIASGSNYTIQWEAPPGAVSFKLKYSMDDGKTWKPIASAIPDTNYDWTVQPPPKNKTKCRVKVIGYNGSGTKLGVDRSDWPFSMEVLRLTSPDGGETLTSGDPLTITWTTNVTKSPVTKVILKYTTNGGKRWRKIAKLTEDTGSHDCTVPDVPKVKSKCKMKVVLKAANRKTVGSDTSDSYFTIEPGL